MPLNSKRLSEIKNKLRPLLKDNKIVDIVLFGSAVKGKALPRDIDVAVISDFDFKSDIEGFHFSILKPSEFFKNPPTLATTLLREGYSLKSGKHFCENLRFKSRVMFVYDLTSLSGSEKVRAVNFLRGKGGRGGLVKEYGAEWISNSVFTSSLDSEYIFEQFFLSNKIKFKRDYILIH